MTNDAFEFGSKDWFRALESIMREEYAAAGPDAPRRFVTSERLTDPPAHLAPAGESIGFTARFEDGALYWTDEPSEDVDVYLEATYDVLYRRMTRSFGEVTPERTESMQSLIDAGKVKASGDRANRPAFMHGVHERAEAVTS